MTRFEVDAASFRAAIDSRLEEILRDCRSNCDIFNDAMQYSTLGGGKRLRPLMTLMTAEAFGAPVENALGPACAIELVHVASLIVDDLPSMDDAETRRGRPANHLVHGESTAILAAIALMNEAFSVVSRSELISASQRLAIVELISKAVGPAGLSGGQNMDLASGCAVADGYDAEAANMAKTGALFVAALEAGAICANVRDARLSALREFGQRFGLTFQIFDDLIDVYSDVGAAGKDVGQDAARQTIVAQIGPENAVARAQAHIQSMLRAIAPFGQQARHFRGLLSWLMDVHLKKMAPSAPLMELRARLEIVS